MAGNDITEPSPVRVDGRYVLVFSFACTLCTQQGRVISECLVQSPQFTIRCAAVRANVFQGHGICFIEFGHSSFAGEGWGIF